jgi:hypothetical protein
MLMVEKNAYQTIFRVKEMMKELWERKVKGLNGKSTLREKTRSYLKAFERLCDENQVVKD